MCVCEILLAPSTTAHVTCVVPYVALRRQEKAPSMSAQLKITFLSMYCVAKPEDNTALFDTICIYAHVNIYMRFATF